MGAKLLPAVDLCRDCETVAGLVQVHRWDAPPYCPVHWLAMVSIITADLALTERATLEIRQREARLRVLGGGPLDADFAARIRGRAS